MAAESFSLSAGKENFFSPIFFCLLFIIFFPMSFTFPPLCPSSPSQKKKNEIKTIKRLVFTPKKLFLFFYVLIGEQSTWRLKKKKKQKLKVIGKVRKKRIGCGGKMGKIQENKESWAMSAFLNFWKSLKRNHYR